MRPNKLASDAPRQYKVVVLGEFWSMFDEISIYISAKWWATSVDNFRAAVWQKITGLGFFPNGYPKWSGTNFRHSLVWDYLIFFQVDEARGTVTVAKIYHAAQNLEELLKNKEEK